MNCKKHVFFILIIASSYVLADDAGPPPQPPVTSTAGPITSTTTKPPTEPTTPTTKPTTPTPPTTKPTDPTPPPTTPTTPTPPPTTPTTPTPSPTKPTTPTPPPTTTARPQPPSDWVVHGPNNTVCIIAKMDMKLTVLYKTDNNKTASAAFDLTNIGNANATGNCSLKADKQLLQLSWSNISSSFEFERNSTAEKYSLSSVELTIPVNKDIFPNITKNETATKITFKHHADVFSVPLSHSFTCANLEPLHLNTTTAINSTYTGTLLITQAHVEAFGVTNKTEYSTAMDCATVLTPDIVPIVVGVILAGLVVVVLIAYLIGRQRAQARGYLSM